MDFSYAHLADLHLGSWREPKIRDLSLRAFFLALDSCLQKKVNFLLIAGDFFNTSLPSLDLLKKITKKLKELQEKNIPIYIIAGSHDFSPSGKTILDVLENAGLLQNVCRGSVHEETKELHLKFTVDPSTGAKITGILGRRGLLDQTYYKNLARLHLEEEPGYKIFLFHTSISEMLPKHLTMVESQPLSFFPKNFQYYAGGHIHHPFKLEQNGSIYTYPGALFPDNFAELEKYGHGGYYYVTVTAGQQEIVWIPLEIIKHLPLSLHGRYPSPEAITQELYTQFLNKDLTNTLITIRLSGILEQGKVSEINFKEIFSQLYQQGAYFVMKNTVKLSTEDFSEIKIDSSDPENIEENIIKEHLQQIKLFNPDEELNLTKTLLKILNTSKKEGENTTDFQERITSELNQILTKTKNN